MLGIMGSGPAWSRSEYGIATIRYDIQYYIIKLRHKTYDYRSWSREGKVCE
jgi:hypothetical protein